MLSKSYEALIDDNCRRISSDNAATKRQYLSTSVFRSAIAFTLSLLIISCSLSDTNAIVIPFRYHNYVRLTRVLQTLNNEYPHLTRLYSIGKSEEG